MTMDIDKIWKKFGDDVKYTSIMFDTSDMKWHVNYDNGRGLEHKEADADMSVAADNLLKWYTECHTYKAAAEALWNLLDKVYSHLSFGYPEICADLSELFNAKDDFIQKIDGALIWNPAYNDNVPNIDKKRDKTTVKEKPAEKKSQTMPEDAKTPDDGFPPYFMIDSTNYSRTECWGHDIEGNRIHVIVDRTDNTNTKIDARQVNANPDMIIAIGEDEFNSYYNEAGSILSALSMGYGIDNFNNYKIIKN